MAMAFVVMSDITKFCSVMRVATIPALPDVGANRIFRVADPQSPPSPVHGVKVDLSGLRGPVTGSTKGIGRGIAQALAANGASPFQNISAPWGSLSPAIAA
jgi:hypothetical protein